MWPQQSGRWHNWCRLILADPITAILEICEIGLSVHVEEERMEHSLDQKDVIGLCRITTCLVGLYWRGGTVVVWIFNPVLLGQRKEASTVGRSLTVTRFSSPLCLLESNVTCFVSFGSSVALLSIHTSMALKLRLCNKKFEGSPWYYRIAVNI